MVNDLPPFAEVSVPGGDPAPGTVGPGTGPEPTIELDDAAAEASFSRRSNNSFDAPDDTIPDDHIPDDHIPDGSTAEPADLVVPSAVPMDLVSPIGPAAPPPAPSPTEAVEAILGRLTDGARWFAQRLPAGGPARRPRLVVIAGDHDGPDRGPADLDHTRGVISRLAESAGAGVREEDLALRFDGPGGPGPFKIRQSHDRSVTADVLTIEQAVAAVGAGRTIAGQEIDAGADLLIPGLLGSGHAVALGSLTAALSGMEPDQAVSISDRDVTAWMSVVADVRDSLFRLRSGDSDAVSLLAAVGGADLAALVGFCAQAAVRRTPVLLDGIPATVAAVLAHRLAPQAESWYIAAGQAPTRAGRRLQEMLGLRTVVDLGTDTPFGAGALLALPLIQLALTELSQHPDLPATATTQVAARSVGAGRTGDDTSLTDTSLTDTDLDDADQVAVGSGSSGEQVGGDDADADLDTIGVRVDAHGNDIGALGGERFPGA